MTERPAGFFTGTGMPDPQWWMALWPDPAEVLATVGVAPGMNVIDLCCGDGWFTAPLSKIARKVTAIDIDAELIEAARVRLAESGGAPNSEFAVADAYDLAAVVREPYDHVFLANAFHGVPDGPRLARAVHAVLKPGGLFAVVNWYARPRETTPILGEPRGPATEQRMTLEQTIASVEPGGLKFRNAVDVSPYHYGAIFERPS
jgi:ubiquinone/menaquinone biosynthesis C-methylase UbiE